jgi:hypothetical protein
MKLIGFSSARQRFHIIRNLTEEEIANYEKYTPLIAEANNRFKLFRILDKNYKEWTNYINSLLTAQQRDDFENDWLELDRLLLNYLSSAYTIQEHFLVSFRRRFRQNTEKLKEYDDFINKLCQTSWEFAFFLDFRGHVQHNGLGVGRYNREVHSTSVILNITHEAADLVAENKNGQSWSRSKLTAGKGTLNLVDLLHDFHGHMRQNFGTYVAKTFFSHLFPIAQFYSNLTNEVRQIEPTFRMCFMDAEPEVKFKQGKQELSLPLKLVANDLFAELGIYISDQTQNVKPTEPAE